MFFWPALFLMPFWLLKTGSLAIYLFMALCPWGSEYPWTIESLCIDDEPLKNSCRENDTWTEQTLELLFKPLDNNWHLCFTLEFVRTDYVQIHYSCHSAFLFLNFQDHSCIWVSNLTLQTKKNKKEGWILSWKLYMTWLYVIFYYWSDFSYTF